MLERLKIRLELNGNEQDALLKELLLSAALLWASLRYPTSKVPVDVTGDAIVPILWSDWVLRCAMELYSKMGTEGQTGHNENGISRAYDSGTVSISLKQEVTPLVGIARA